MNDVELMMIRLMELLKSTIKVILYLCNSWLRLVTITKPYKLGENIVILGNGPNQIDFWNNIDRYANYDILCVNLSIVEIYDKLKKYNVKYVVLSDPIFFVNDKSKKTTTELEGKIKAVWKTLDEITWDIYLVIPARYSKAVKLDNRYIHYIYLTPFQTGSIGGKEKYYNLYCKNILKPQMQTVINDAIYFAIVFKYRKIALFGVESDWTRNIVVKDKNLVIHNDTHVYGNTEEVLHESVARVFQDSVYVFESYHTLEMIAERNNIQIINYCKKSMIDAFRKRNVADL